VSHFRLKTYSHCLNIHITKKAPITPASVKAPEVLPFCC